MKEFWDSRYSQEAFAYGEDPNEFFSAQIGNFAPGNILFPAEGEGRNSVYAASLGWKVSAFDISSEGKKKADNLARRRQVVINYQVGDLSNINYPKEQFDAIGLIYAHFPIEVRSSYHSQLAGMLKKGGVIILEAFSKRHLAYNSNNKKVGGPGDLNLLYSIEEIRTDFKDFDFLILTEQEVELNEGLYHIGLGSVIRFVGRKI
jgi:SAM-dependent methyltransferase